LKLMDLQELHVQQDLWMKVCFYNLLTLSWTFRQDLELETPVGNISSIVIHQVSQSEQQLSFYLANQNSLYLSSSQIRETDICRASKSGKRSPLSWSTSQAVALSDSLPG
jgi:hypothetical protein